MDWCCLAGLLAGGVPPGRIRIWGILISLHLFSLSGRVLWGGDGGAGSGGPFGGGGVGGVMDSAVLVVERCADSEVGGREGGPLAGLFPGWSIFVELYICFGNILWSR